VPYIFYAEKTGKMMKKIFNIKTLILTSLLTLLSLVFLMAGCTSDTVEDPGIIIDSPESVNDDTSVVVFNPQEHIYVPEIIQFPELDGFHINMNNVILANDKVWFPAWEWDEDRPFNFSRLYHMDADGMNLTELPNYKPEPFPANTTRGGVSINALYVDNESNVWIAESRFIDDLEQPDDWSINVIRKLDKTGTEISIFDLSSLAALNELFYVQKICIDGAGNIYLISETSIYVLDDQGRFLFELDNYDWIASLIKLSDGMIAIPEHQASSLYLKIIDPEQKSWGEVISLPSNAVFLFNVYSGIGQYRYLYSGGGHLNGVVAETGEHEVLLNWVDIALSSDDINSVMFMTDGRIVAIRQTFGNVTGTQPTTELLLLTIASRDEIPEKKTLTFGTFYYNSESRYAIEEFNMNSTTHRIEVIDYSQYNTGDDNFAGRLRLNTDIIAGNCPDILDMWTMPLQTFASKGLLVDLYPLLDADPHLGRETFIENLLDASETYGSLYQLITSFRISTIIGNPSVLGDYSGWDMDEFISVFKANPGADMPMGMWSSKDNFFTTIMRGNMERFVDWESGAAFFDNDYFIQVLEMANTFPPAVDEDNTISRYDLVASGRQIMEMSWFSGVSDFAVSRVMFDGELVFKGLPNENREGNSFIPDTSFAISINCKDIDNAWEFLRLMLLEDYQRDVISDFRLPVNRDVFEEYLETSYVNFTEGRYTIRSSDGLFLEEIDLIYEELELVKR